MSKPYSPDQIIAFCRQIQQILQPGRTLLLDGTRQIIWQYGWQHKQLHSFIRQLSYQTLQGCDELVVQDENRQNKIQQFIHLQRQIDTTGQPLSLHLLFEKPPHTPAVPETTPDVLQQVFHSRSAEMQQMFTIIRKVAITGFPVLVRGESGSGKELVAQAIHDHSQRRQQPFIAINCAALNVNILESELFGHVKGAFTGAIRDHKGVFERAAGGTLFLDEIAEIPLELQAKLLRVLETGEFNRLGGEKSIKSDVRIIAATHKALREEARFGRFRQDLLYRLRVIPIFVPPLRARKSDIPLLATFILEQNKPGDSACTPDLSGAALAVLMRYDWPGNVRELKNTLLYALTMSQGRGQIDADDLPQEIVDFEEGVSNPTDQQVKHLFAMPQAADFIQEKELPITKQRLQQALAQYADRQTAVARALGISRSTLWRYRKKFGV